MDKEFLLSLELSEETAERILEAHQAQIQEITFQSKLREAVQTAGGRNLKAIGALLDQQELKQAQDQDQALNEALKRLKAENSYLFITPPPYAPEPGTRGSTPTYKPATLAGAIRQKYERK